MDYVTTIAAFSLCSSFRRLSTAELVKPESSSLLAGLVPAQPEIQFVPGKPAEDQRKAGFRPAPE
jgi:hypothetical protein